MKIIHKLTNNAYVFSVIAKIISVATGLLYSVLYSRYLHAELRGSASIINNYADIIMLILCFGIYQGYPYFKKKNGVDIYEEFINLIFALFFTYALVGTLIIVLFQPGTYATVAIILIPFMFGTKQLNYVVLMERPKLRNSAQIFLDIWDILFITVLMFVVEADLFICIIILISKEVVYFTIAVINLKFNIFKIRPSFKKLMPYVKFGFIPMITVIMMEINYKADVIMLEKFGVTEAQIGVYGLGVTLAQKVWLIPDALKDILLSNLAKGKDESEVSKITRLSLAIMVGCVLVLLVVAKPFVDILYGDEYSGAYEIIVILIVGIIGMVFYKMIYSYNVINGHKNINLLFLSIAAVVNIGVNAITIPYWGIYGAGLASSVSYLICGIVFLIYFCKKTGTPFSDMLLIKKSDLALMKGIFK
ncbi:MAG: polysaccharide biosynthesis C-terminal domain-containing protein [Lachnospiraceae bacterium]|nr:polysaccharide biosynthesis C-terminal domain-containing protein [Lachnospiraceae bacterium]